MKEVTTKEHHVDISFFGKAHDLMKGLPGIIAANWISFIVANMVVRGD